MMNSFITGAAGFIGSSMVDRLLQDGHKVTGWDNFSSGQEKFLEKAIKHPNFTLIRGDNLEIDSLGKAMVGHDIVFHFAANADVRFGLSHPNRDFEQNTVATFNILEAMRANGIKKIAFSSTGSVYGESRIIPTPEDAPFPIQTSLYAASKVAGETLIQSYCEGFGFEGYIFRFVSILGERYTHGHVFDFYAQLMNDPHKLRILGNGTQRKSYLHVGDCIEAILTVIRGNTAASAKHHVQIYNLGCDEYVEVNRSIEVICRTLGVSPELEYTGGNKGWIGDNPFIFLDTAKICQESWKPKMNIEDSIVRTVNWLKSNEWVFQHRR